MCIPEAVYPTVIMNILALHISLFHPLSYQTCFKTWLNSLYVRKCACIYRPDCGYVFSKKGEEKKGEKEVLLFGFQQCITYINVHSQYSTVFPLRSSFTLGGDLSENLSLQLKSQQSLVPVARPVQNSTKPFHSQKCNYVARLRIFYRGETIT